MSMIKGLSATAIALAVASASLLGATAGASANTYKKPTICIVLPLCQQGKPAPLVPVMHRHHHRHHHHHHHMMKKH